MGGGSQKSDQVLIPNPVVHTHVGSTNVVRSLRQRSTLVVQTRGQTMPGGYYVRSMEEAHRQTMRVDTLEPRCGKFQKKTPPLRMAQSDRVLVGSRERFQVYIYIYIYVSERFTQCFFSAVEMDEHHKSHTTSFFTNRQCGFPPLVMLKKNNECCFVIPKKRNQPEMLHGSWTPKKSSFRKPSD